jgi:hypothetical protein
MTPLGGLPQPPLLDKSNEYRFTTQWAGWFAIAQNILQATSSSGPTTGRPTKNTYVGMFYLDTTLGIPVWLLTPGSSPVWINASGAPV